MNNLQRIVHAIIDEAEKLSEQVEEVQKRNNWVSDKLRENDTELRELKREIIYIVFWAVVLVCVCTVGGFLLGRRSMTVTDTTAETQTIYPIEPLMEQRDTFDDELLAVMPFNRFVDLYPRLVETHDKDFTQQALDGKKIYAMACYFIRKPE